MYTPLNRNFFLIGTFFFFFFLRDQKQKPLKNPWLIPQHYSLVKKWQSSCTKLQTRLPAPGTQRDPEVLTSPPPNSCATFQDKSAVAVLLILVIFQPYNLVQIFSLAGYIK